MRDSKTTIPSLFLGLAIGLAGCQHGKSATSAKGAAETEGVTNRAVATAAVAGKDGKIPRRYSYTPRPYPVDERGFSPVDKALAKTYAREEVIIDDAEGSLNPYVLKVISGYPLDGSYAYHCSWE